MAEEINKAIIYLTRCVECAQRRLDNRDLWIGEHEPACAAGLLAKAQRRLDVAIKSKAAGEAGELLPWVKLILPMIDDPATYPLPRNLTGLPGPRVGADRKLVCS